VYIYIEWSRSWRVGEMGESRGGKERRWTDVPLQWQIECNGRER
jgi:hypothetical protein